MSASAQLAYYEDESGKRVYVNLAQKEVAPAPVAVASARNKATVKATLKPASKITTAKDAKIDTIVEETARRHDVDANLVRAVIRAESNNDPRAVSNKGARGLMQLMPPTARDLGVTNVLDPAQNVDGGVRYLKYLLTMYGGDTKLSLAAYNAGPGAVEKHRGVPPFRETRDYVKKIGDLYAQFKSQLTHEEQHMAQGILRTVDETGRVMYTNMR